MTIFPLSLFTVSGNSMMPTLKSGTKVLSFNWSYLFRKPRKKEIVLAKVGGRLVIKRIQKTEGEKIYLVGDNPKESTDSRSYGWIHNWQIIGKVIFFIQP